MRTSGRSTLWPRYGAIFPLDLVASLTVMLVCAGIALQHVPALVSKAKLSEVYHLVAAKRYELVETLALSGEPVELDLGGLREGSKGPKSADAEELLAGRRMERKAAEPPKGADLSRSGDLASAQKQVEARRAARETQAAEGGAQSIGRYVSNVRLVETTIVATARLESGGPAYELAIYPAVPDEETPAVYVWLCGRQLPALGLLARAPAVRTSVPNSLLPSECRRRREA
jgi:hypothetical protein